MDPHTVKQWGVHLTNKTLINKGSTCNECGVYLLFILSSFDPNLLLSPLPTEEEKIGEERVGEEEGETVNETKEGLLILCVCMYITSSYIFSLFSASLVLSFLFPSLSSSLLPLPLPVPQVSLECSMVSLSYILPGTLSFTHHNFTFTADDSSPEYNKVAKIVSNNNATEEVLILIYYYFSLIVVH